MTRQLSAWAAFTHAVASVRDNLHVAFRVSWAWYALILLATAALQFITTETPRTSGEPSFSDFVLAVLTLVSSASIAVNWHRYILADELPDRQNLLRFDSLMWRYLGNLLLIGLIIFGAMVPISVLALVNQQSMAGFIILIIFGLPLAGLLFLRLGVKLPAVALDDRNFGLKDAWRHTSGNAWQIIALFALNIALALAMSAVIYGVGQILEQVSTGFAALVSAILELAANWVMTIFGITVLTSLYGFFVQHRDF